MYSSLKLSIFTVLHYHHHHPSPDCHFPKLKLYSFINNSPFHQHPSYPPAPGNHHFTFCLYEFEASRCFIQVESCSIYDWLISLSIMSSRFIHVHSVSEFPSFLRLNNIPSHVYTTFYLSIHPLMHTLVASTIWLLQIILLQTRVQYYLLESLLLVLQKWNCWIIW